MVQGRSFREKPRLDDVLRGVLRFVAGLIAAKPCSGDMESGRVGGFAAIRCAVIVAVYVLSGGTGEAVSLTE